LKTIVDVQLQSFLVIVGNALRIERPFSRVEWLTTYPEDFEMAEITAALVKELRERTGEGM